MAPFVRSLAILLKSRCRISCRCYLVRTDSSLACFHLISSCSTSAVRKTICDKSQSKYLKLILLTFPPPTSKSSGQLHVKNTRHHDAVGCSCLIMVLYFYIIISYLSIVISASITVERHGMGCALSYVLCQGDGIPHLHTQAFLQCWPPGITSVSFFTSVVYCLWADHLWALAFLVGSVCGFKSRRW